MSVSIGEPTNRVDGRLKVTGNARYSADHVVTKVAHGVPVVSAIAKGRVSALDPSRALEASGVLAVLTRENTPPVKPTTNNFGSWTKLGEARLLFADDEVHYAGQYLALVVADTLERAVFAASLVDVTYDELPPLIETPSAAVLAHKESVRGDVPSAFAQAPHTVSATYRTPTEHHNPMEPSASTAVWKEHDLTLYDSTQWVMAARYCVADMLGVSRDHVHICSEFVGGGFGCKGFTWPHQALAPLAAREVQRPVKLNLSRQQMFAACGHRPATVQTVALAADAEGKLLAIRHHATNQTSTVDKYVEGCGGITQYLYACPNLDIRHDLAPVNIATPTSMRAPGEAPGLFALESAMDELAGQLKLDPVELRLRNYAEQDFEKKLPFSSKHLRECYEQGQEIIGWDKRSIRPGTSREGRYLIGYGMASATYPAYRSPAAAVVRVYASGHVDVTSATQDIGTGTYTIMTQVAADTLGVPLTQIHVRLGDSNLPPAPVSGGSMTTASVTPAVKAAAEDALHQLRVCAVESARSPFLGLPRDSLYAREGRLHSQDGRKVLPFAEIVRLCGEDFIEGKAKTQPGRELKQHSFHSFGAQFATVRVDPELCTVRVQHLAGVFDTGKIINPKTARSQMLSGMIQGLGMALMEETLYDHRNGRVVTDNLADYLIPVHADTPRIDVHFLDKPDPAIGGMGARGVGEIAITGVAPAITNAIYNATGWRLRDLPVTIDKLLRAQREHSS